MLGRRLMFVLAAAGQRWAKRYGLLTEEVGVLPDARRRENEGAEPEADGRSACRLRGDAALTYPLGERWIEPGLRRLFDLGILGVAVDLRPGDLILDFASGCGWASEILGRFGCRTVAVDWDVEMVAAGRARIALDRRNATGRSEFVAADCARLPLRDGVVDGVVCLHSLHHMPDYGAVLAEIYRVLKPGGRAAFAEPGSLHSRLPISVAQVSKLGGLERDVVAAEIHALAKRAGFSRMVLKPYLYADRVDVDYERFDRLRHGRGAWRTSLPTRSVASLIELSHLVFYLQKPGERPLTSESGGMSGLDARIRVEGCPRRAAPGGEIRVIARCRNRGDSTWLCAARPGGGFVTLGVKILAEDGRLVDDGRGRTPLSRDVPPGEEVEVEARVSLTDLPPGNYRLSFDMVNEEIGWFAQAGSRTVVEPLEIASNG